VTQLELEIQTGYLGPVKDPNPMVRIHGPGPEGATCGTCAHLIGWQYSKVYWKCSLRGDLTHGAKTDQKKTWQACGLYDESD
jgi:hypothetical protein